MSDSEPRTSSHRATMLFLGLVAAAVAVFVWMGRAPNQIPAEDAERLAQLAQRGLALLENERFEESADLLEQLATALPDEPFAARNLVIARLEAVRQINGVEHAEAHAAALQLAQDALKRLIDQGGPTATTHLLGSKLAAQAGDEAEAVAQMEAAARLDPENASMWFELFRSAEHSSDEQRKARSAEALDKAFERKPDNLFVVVLWLRMQSERLRAKAADKTESGDDTADLGEKLELVRTSIEPVLAPLEKLLRMNAGEFIDATKDGIAAGEWAVASSNLGLLSNALLPDARSDRLRIEKNPQEFLIRQLSDSFFERAELPSPPTSTPNVELASLQVEGQALNKPARRVYATDFGVDGAIELLILNADTLTVCASDGGAASGPWQPICGVTIEEMSDFLVADLDDDVEENAALAKQHESICHETDVDVVLFGPGGLQVVENVYDASTGSRSLKPIDGESFADLKNVLSVRVADLDHDGDLDLVVSAESGVTFWSNRGNMVFEAMSSTSVLPPADFQSASMVPVDWDRDVDLDVILLSGSGDRIGIMENLRHGRLVWREWDLPNGDGPSSAQTIKIIDANLDASWDLLVAEESSGLRLFESQTHDDGDIQLVGTQLAVDISAKGLQVWDYDNDGRLDLLLWDGQRLSAAHGEPDGKFQLDDKVTASLPEGILSFDVNDIDKDGDTDLVVATESGISVWSNEGGNSNGWVDVALRAAQVKGTQASESGRVNHQGVGSLLELRTDQLYQPRVVERGITHFGLGDRDTAEFIRVLWTNGIPQNVIDAASKNTVCEKQTLKGSCPYLYTWDGEKFVFHTDLLWAAPIGLQFATGERAPIRNWEYIKIPGSRLAARDGQYAIQITEELWEAAYFDHVRLIAVDHPANVEIFSNEKVGPAEMAAFKIHTVRERRTPIAARDQRGRDVLEFIKDDDDRYLRAFDRKYRQGLTEEHTLELQFDDLGDAEAMTLFLTGWIYPTDTSINVGISQNDSLKPPAPPSLWMPDDEGEWQCVQPFMGFPGGKTKTIAVPIDVSRFSETDYRIRIATSMEIYWDAAFYTVNEESAETRVQQLAITAADLHYRGFSKRIPHAGNGPERYEYSEVERHASWPPMMGRFTRFGSVAPLLENEDDIQVVMGSGDEMTIHFAAPAEGVPQGWTRDFLLYSVGWDKDADLNTLAGQAVEPLPFRAMTQYPYEGHGEFFPDTTKHREFLKTFQTRTLSRKAFWRPTQ